jgi:secretion/DNA translocation related TadE-like protein
MTGGLLVASGAAAVATVLAVVVGHERAVAAADLAALAAAGRLDDAPDRACPEAAAVASANGARLRACVVDGFAVTVTVETVRTGTLLPTFQASSRAGLPTPGQSMLDVG